MYHMIDYIHEEPTALRRTLEESDAVVETLVAGVRDRRWDRLIVVGVGSSYTAALMALPAFRLHSPIPVEVLPSTELGPYRDRWLGPRTLVISVSRSGERGWVVDEQRAARVAGSYTVAMSGVADSLLALEADLLLPTAEGPEITFSKTKSVITCAGLLMNLAFRLAPSGDALARQRLRDLASIPALLDRTINATETTIAEITSKLDAIDRIYLCGSGSNHGAALEGAIKIHETSFIVTKAEDTGSCLHGVLGTTDPRWLVVALAAHEDAAMTRAVLRLAGVGGARRMVISEPGLIGSDDAEYVVETAGKVDPTLAGLVYLPPLQLLTYHLTVARGLNPDAPSYMWAQFEAMLPAGRMEPELRAGLLGDDAMVATPR
jgi:glucosamine--fructose-6-phosphate aminotransferase (isomerizing)